MCHQLPPSLGGMPEGASRFSLKPIPREAAGFCWFCNEYRTDWQYSRRKVKTQAEEKPIQNQALQPAEEVVLLTQEALDLALPRIRASFQDAGKSMELAILGQEIKIVEGQLILEVMGQLQEDLADKMKSELVRMLREITKSTKVTIKLEVKEELQSNVNRLYTSTDKLNHLKKIHPALSEFQNRFGLETDF